MTPIILAPLPAALDWDSEPPDWRIDPDQTLRITAGGHTDMFLDPRGQVETLNAPRLLFAVTAGQSVAAAAETAILPADRWTLGARVTVGFAATYDAGALLIYAGPTRWAKLCFELSPQGQPMIVSVVTDGRSDDCNSALIAGDTVYLRATGLGGAYAFHYSEDGAAWHLVRYFALGRGQEEPQGLRIGFEAQSPTGAGCAVSFAAIAYAPEAVADIRSGA